MPEAILHEGGVDIEEGPLWYAGGEHQIWLCIYGAGELGQDAGEVGLSRLAEEEWGGHDAQTSKKGKGRAVCTGGSVSTAMHKSRIVSIYSYKWFLVFCSLLDLKTDKW